MAGNSFRTRDRFPVEALIYEVVRLDASTVQRGGRTAAHPDGTPEGTHKKVV
jgi:hypothetical protein